MFRIYSPTYDPWLFLTYISIYKKSLNIILLSDKELRYNILVATLDFDQFTIDCQPRITFQFRTMKGGTNTVVVLRACSESIFKSSKHMSVIVH